MHLVDNWRQTLTRAWSVRFMALAFVFTALEAALPVLGDALPVSPGLFAGLSGVTTAAAFVSRLVAQRNMDDDR